MMNFKPVNLHSSRGASMLEFSLVCGVFFFLLLAFIDFVRILSVQVVLTSGSQKGLQLAQRIPAGEFDIRATQVDDERYQRFVNARAQVLELAASFPAATFADSSNRPRSASQLIGFQQSDLLLGNQLVAWPADSRPRVDAILLRPGDQARGPDGIVIDHPTLCPPVSIKTLGKRCQAQGVARLADTDKWTTVLQEHPLMVEMCAAVEMLLPGFSAVRTCRRAVGFRIIPQTADPGAGSFSPSTMVCRPGCVGQQLPVDVGCGCYCPSFSCPGNKVRVETPDFCDCVCPPYKDCGHLPNHVWDPNPSVCDCRCNLTDSQCPPNHTLQNCQCVCALDQNICAQSSLNFDSASCTCQIPCGGGGGGGGGGGEPPQCLPQWGDEVNCGGEYSITQDVQCNDLNSPKCSWSCCKSTTYSCPICTPDCCGYNCTTKVAYRHKTGPCPNEPYSTCCWCDEQACDILINCPPDVCGGNGGGGC